MSYKSCQIIYSMKNLFLKMKNTIFHRILSRNKSEERIGERKKSLNLLLFSMLSIPIQDVKHEFSA